MEVQNSPLIVGGFRNVGTGGISGIRERGTRAIYIYNDNLGYPYYPWRRFVISQSDSSDTDSGSRWNKIFVYRTHSERREIQA